MILFKRSEQNNTYDVTKQNRFISMFTLFFIELNIIEIYLQLSAFEIKTSITALLNLLRL